ncbi:MAG TPA: tripartite tricarboxylate transporter substrate binding protein [Burkholderiales bacterium]|nr:tripartite tricarboxylate transporter substrate binding protein [Burkholderiales bacterium]
MNRITLPCALLCGAAFTASISFAWANPTASKFPNNPVRFIVPFSAGGGTDTTARTIAAKLSEKWGQQVVTDNRTGAAGAIGVELTANANPDGYTICLVSASTAVNSATNPKLPYDLTKDLQGITQATSLFYVVYHNPSLPVKSIKELIAYAKANPGKLNFGTSGTGGLQHVGGELFNHMAGVKIVHVPYKGGATVVPAMIANEVQMGYASLFAVRPQVQAGRLNWIAITAKKRSPIVDLPTVAESGLPGFEVDQWYGIVTSSKVPRPVVQQIHAAIADVLKMPDVVQRLGADGSTPVGSAPDAFNAHVKAEIAKWRKLVKDANLKLH